MAQNQFAFGAPALSEFPAALAGAQKRPIWPILLRPKLCPRPPAALYMSDFCHPDHLARRAGGATPFASATAEFSMPLADLCNRTELTTRQAVREARPTRPSCIQLGKRVGASGRGQAGRRVGVECARLSGPISLPRAHPLSRSARCAQAAPLLQAKSALGVANGRTAAWPA